MARVYERQQDPLTGGLQAPRLPAISGAAVGAEALSGALQQTAQGGQILGAAEMRRLDLEGAAYDNRALARLEADSRAYLRELEEQATSGRDHAKRFAEWYGERRREILGEAPKGYDRGRLVAELDGLKVTLGDRADAFERKARVEFQVMAIGDAHDDRRRMTIADPSLHGRMIEQTRAAFAALDVPPMVAARLERDALRDLEGDRIEGLIFREPARALADLDRGAAPDLDPDRRARLMHQARSAVETEQARARAAAEQATKVAGEEAGARIFGLGIDGPAGGNAAPGTGRRATLGAMLAEARKIGDPLARKAAEGRILELYGQDEKARADRRRQLSEAAFGHLEEGGRVTDIDPAAWAELDNGTRRALEDRQRQVAAGIEPVTDWDTYLALERMSDEELKGQDLRRLRPYLSDAHFQRFAARQGQILDGGTTDDPASLHQQIAAAADRFGLDGEDRGLFVDRAYRAIDQEQRRTGANLDFAARQKLVDALTLHGTTRPGWIFDTRKRAFEASLADQQTFRPRDLEDQAVELANALGVAPDEVGGLAATVDALGVAVTLETLDTVRALEAVGLEPSMANLLELWALRNGVETTIKQRPEPSEPPAAPPRRRTIQEVWDAEVAP